MAKKVAKKTATRTTVIVQQTVWPWILGGLGALLILSLVAYGALFMLQNKIGVAPQIINVPASQPIINVNNPPAAQPATNPGPAVSSPLTISEFARMWSASSEVGLLMEELNVYFDNGGYQFGGQFSGKDGWDIPAGSVVWTDLLDQSNQVFYVGTTNPVNTTNDFVRLRCQGNWCVFYTYAAVRLPTPGRFLSTDRWLDPANDLSGW